MKNIENPNAVEQNAETIKRTLVEPVVLTYVEMTPEMLEASRRADQYPIKYVPPGGGLAEK